MKPLMALFATLMTGSAIALGASAASAATLAGSVTQNGRPVAAQVLVEHLAGAPKAAVMKQQNLAFAPGKLTVAKGATVSFPNLDNVFHSAYSKSSSNPFDLGLYAKSAKKSVVMKNVGVVEVQCRVHRQMKATITVVEAAASAPTNAAGHFAFDHLAPGYYRVIATLPDGSARQNFVKVGGANVTLVALGFGAPDGIRRQALVPAAWCDAHARRAH